MNVLLRVLAVVFAVGTLVLTGCATKAPKPDPMLSDRAAGTDASPYRSIPAHIQCDNCRYGK